VTQHLTRLPVQGCKSGSFRDVFCDELRVAIYFAGTAVRACRKVKQAGSELNSGRIQGGLRRHCQDHTLTDMRSSCTKTFYDLDMSAVSSGLSSGQSTPRVWGRPCLRIGQRHSPISTGNVIHLGRKARAPFFIKSCRATIASRTSHRSVTTRTSARSRLFCAKRSISPRVKRVRSHET
jgi:hypothetical protein